MKHRSTICILLAVIVMAFLMSAAIAQQKPAAKPMDTKEMSDRIQSLEKENLVLREDLGKARLDAKSDLSKEVDKLNQAIAETNAKMEKERAAQAKRTRNLWIAVGVAAIAALAD